MSNLNVRRGRLALQSRKADADERAKNYKAPKSPGSLRECIKRGLMSKDDALAFVGPNGSPAFIRWARNFKKGK